MPITFRHSDSGAGKLLNRISASRVVGMGVRHNDVLDVLRIQIELLHAHWDVIREFLIKTIDQNQASTGFQDVGTHRIQTHVIQVIENPERRNRLRPFLRCGNLALGYYQDQPEKRDCENPLHGSPPLKSHRTSISQANLSWTN